MARFISADTNPTSLQCSRATRARSVIAGVFVAAFLGTTTHVVAAATPSRQVIENHACSVTLGLDPSEADYAACAGSIDRTLSLVGARQAAAEDRQDCAEQGLRAGTAALSRCVVEAGEAPATDWSAPISAR